MSARDDQMTEIKTLLMTLATTHDLDAVRVEIASMKKDIEALNGLKSRGVGFLMGAAIVGGVLGDKFIDAFMGILGK